jgi:peptide-methionine (S)-S-oxide reductase
MTKSSQQITLAGGCFWCIESAFNSLQGILSAVSGYMGGESEQPGYESVCSGTTGHAEVVQLNFDSELINTREILEVFFALHDPTQLNRQGNDVGSQYRSAIFFHDTEQEIAALQIIKEINADKMWPNPVVTEVVKVEKFYCGEEYHQDYFANNPESQYCQVVISPKLAKFKKTFASKLK